MAQIPNALEVIHDEFALAPWTDRLQMAKERDQVASLKPDELDGIIIATSRHNKWDCVLTHDVGSQDPINRTCIT